MPTSPFARNAIISGVVSVVALATLLVAYAWPLWTGEIIHLRVRPVDPRDTFRGDYVRLGYDFGRVRIKVDESDPRFAPRPPSDAPNDARVAGPAQSQEPALEPLGSWWEDIQRERTRDAVLERWTRLRGRRLYVLLRPEELVNASGPTASPADAEYTAFALADRPHSALQSATGTVSLRARVRFAQFPFLTLDNPIDAYFVQEGTGHVVEQALRDGKRVVVAVAVTPSGDARVKELIVDGPPR